MAGILRENQANMENTMRQPVSKAETAKEKALI